MPEMTDRFDSLEFELTAEEKEELRKRELRQKQREHEQSIERQKSILRRPKQLNKK